MYKFEDIFRLLDKDDDLYENPAIFKSLSENDILRNYYKEALNIKFASSHFPVIYPDKQVKTDLFNKLGITNSNLNIKKNDKKEKKNFAFIPYIITSVLSILLTFLLMRNYNQPVNNQFMDKPVINNFEKNSNNADLSNTFFKKTFDKANKTKSNNIGKYPKKTNNVSNQEKRTIYNYDKENFPISNFNGLITKADFSDLQYPIKVETSLNNTNIIPEMNRNSINNLDTENCKSGFALKFSIFTDRHKNEPAIAPAKWADFNNTMLEIGYEINNYINLGLEYRRENFYQIYQGSESGKLFEYEQQPNLETMSATLKITPVQIYFAEPYISIKSGVNIGGYVFRGGIGTSVYLNDTFGFDVGVEFSQFNYYHNNIRNQSEKASFLIGLIYNF